MVLLLFGTVREEIDIVYGRKRIDFLTVGLWQQTILATIQMLGFTITETARNPFRYLEFLGIAESDGKSGHPLTERFWKLVQLYGIVGNVQPFSQEIRIIRLCIDEVGNGLEIAFEDNLPVLACFIYIVFFDIIDTLVLHHLWEGIFQIIPVN